MKKITIISMLLMFMGFFGVANAATITYSIQDGATMEEFDGVFTITIEGQKIMVTGDSAEDEFRMAASKYGSYLKSDILQLSHHGGGNGMGDHDLYKLVNAPVVFHPNPNKNGLGANEKWAVNNAQLVIRSGNYGIATLKLPFKVGDAFDYTGDPVEENGK